MSKLYLVAFDVSDAKRLRQVAKTVLDYGVRVQYSLFECHLEEADLNEMRSILETIIDPVADRIHIFHICGKDEKAICVTGGQYVSQDRDYFIE